MPTLIFLGEHEPDESFKIDRDLTVINRGWVRRCDLLLFEAGFITKKVSQFNGH